MDQAYLKQRLCYYSNTGQFFWQRSKLMPAWWNGKYAGTLAGTPLSKPTGLTYTRITVDGIQYLAHRLAFLYMTGEFPLDQVDYKQIYLGLYDTYEEAHEIYCRAREVLNGEFAYKVPV